LGYAIVCHLFVGLSGVTLMYADHKSSCLKFYYVINQPSISALAAHNFSKLMQVKHAQIWNKTHLGRKTLGIFNDKGSFLSGDKWPYLRKQ